MGSVVTWGYPTYRVIPVDVPPSDIGVSHLQINTGDIMADPNILLPIEQFQELAAGRALAGDPGHGLPHTTVVKSEENVH